MPARTLRPVLVAVLLVSGIAGGITAYVTLRASEARTTLSQDVLRRLDLMAGAALEIGVAQEAYVAPGQPERPWLDRVSTLVEQLRDEAGRVGAAANSTDTASALQTFVAAIDRLAGIDTRVRGHLVNGQDLSASDLVFSEAHQTIAAAVATLRELQDRQRVLITGERAAAASRAWSILIAVAALWAIGLVSLMRVKAPAASPLQQPAPAVVAVADPTTAEPVCDQAAVIELAPFNRDLVAAAPVETAPTLDLAAAADLCLAISRLTASEALPDLLARTAVVLDASGVILWMAAGDELFSVAAYGYDPHVVARLGPIGRQANNATADAWRSGEARLVTGDVMSNGAIAVPMIGIDSCTGVLAAELRHGREADPAVRAIATMIAAQLATVVAAWPAGSNAIDADRAHADPVGALL